MKTQLLTMVLLVTACTTPKEPVRPPKSDTVKPGAPSSVATPKLTDTSAQIEVRFEGAGENVAVTVSGIDGLTVTSPAEAVSNRTAKAGDTLPLEVTFTGRGHVVLTVQGTFNGAAQSRVHTVKVGEGLKDDGSKTQVTTDGDAVKLMP